MSLHITDSKAVFCPPRKSVTHECPYSLTLMCPHKVFQEDFWYTAQQWSVVWGSDWKPTLSILGLWSFQCKTWRPLLRCTASYRTPKAVKRPIHLKGRFCTETAQIMKALGMWPSAPTCPNVQLPTLTIAQYNGKLPIAVQIQTSIVLLVSLLNCVLKTGGQESQLHSHSMKKSPV